MHQETAMTQTRDPAIVTRTIRGMAASDGAGVKLTRVIGSPQLDMLDPFLLLDELGTDRAEDYIAGFPDHPHRGFETVTYMLDGRMRTRTTTATKACRSEEHTSELQSLMRISYAVFCLKNKNNDTTHK